MHTGIGRVNLNARLPLSKQSCIHLIDANLLDYCCHLLWYLLLSDDDLITMYETEEREIDEIMPEAVKISYDVK